MKKTMRLLIPLMSIFCLSLTGCTLETRQTNIKSVSAEEFKKLITEKQPNDTILDLRTTEEFFQGHIEGAKLLDYYKPNFKNELNKLDKETNYYIYCRSGRRSKETLNIMKKLGFQKVYNLKKGINERKEKSYHIKNNDTSNIPIPERAVYENYKEEENKKTSDYVVYKDIQTTKNFYDRNMSDWKEESKREKKGNTVQKKFSNNKLNINISISENNLCITKTTLEIKETKK